MSAGQESWGQWLVNGTVWTTLGGAVAWVTGVFIQRRRHSDELAEKKRAREERLNEHASSLAVELLRIATSEATALKQQIAELTAQVGHVTELERRVGYFEEALVHIKQLLDPEPEIGRAAAEDAARLFLGKMIILREAKGRLANREQVNRAAQSLGDKGE